VGGGPCSEPGVKTQVKKNHETKLNPNLVKEADHRKTIIRGLRGGPFKVTKNHEEVKWGGEGLRGRVDAERTMGHGQVRLKRLNRFQWGRLETPRKPGGIKTRKDFKQERGKQEDNLASRCSYGGNRCQS